MQGPIIDLYRFLHTANKALIFLETVLAIDIMQEPQFSLEEKNNPSILKDDFSSRTDSSIFTSIVPALLDWSNEAS